MIRGISTICFATSNVHQVTGPWLRCWPNSPGRLRLWCKCCNRCQCIWVFPKIMVPPNQIIHFNRVFHYKPSILGYHYFWKHPYIWAHYYTSKTWIKRHFGGYSLTKPPIGVTSAEVAVIVICPGIHVYIYVYKPVYCYIYACIYIHIHYLDMYMCYIWKPFDDFFGPLIQLE